MQLATSKFHSSHSLSCVVIGTDGAPASGVASYDWNVLECLPRPLGIVITDSPMVEPISGEFSITVAFKDEALDEIADPSIGLPVGVDCNISLADASSLNGDNQFTMDHSSKFIFLNSIYFLFHNAALLILGFIFGKNSWINYCHWFKY